MAHGKKSGTNQFLIPAAQEELQNGLTSDEGEGWIYMLKITDPQNEQERNLFKIGMTERPEYRIREQKRRNNEEYTVICIYRTPYRRKTEQVIKKQLGSQHCPRAEGDGRTEWFRGKCAEIKSTIEKVVRAVKKEYDE